MGTASGLVPIPLLPGYPISDGSAINASGMVAGFAVTSLGQSIAFIGTSNSATPLPMVSGWNFMTALAINSAGEVAGWGGDASGHTQAYLGTPAASSAIPMPYLATDTMIAAGSMNDARMVVGSSTISGVNLGGWIWDATDGPVLLNALVVSPAWNITNAISISGNGLILAQASYQGGPVQFVELSPSPCSFSLNPGKHGFWIQRR